MYVALDQSTVFQLTTSQGGRRDRTAGQLIQEFFQLTTSQGGRPTGDIQGHPTPSSFNSRPHKEVDL